jgi:hypothetical protein
MNYNYGSGADRGDVAAGAGGCSGQLSVSQAIAAHLQHNGTRPNGPARLRLLPHRHVHHLRRQSKPIHSDFSLKTREHCERRFDQQLGKQIAEQKINFLMRKSVK